ncbi:fimbrial protein [Pseudomonas paraeruginosa]|uniref:fimbrial protein n=1 Tax=Pseudomonas aeruginosa group TaxID=136841 RepID=UPI0009AD169D|nr:MULTISPECIES: fimbrial protein [Pseudomonas aeruginosa group]KSF77550.2 hypothetical protein AO940_14990 [Pseudomonas aeruginosa]PTC35819.1 Fimbrial protein precursor [Pseudomonas aeruginosa]
MSKNYGQAAPKKARMLGLVPMMKPLSISGKHPDSPPLSRSRIVLRRVALALFAWQFSCSAMAACEVGSGGVYRATLSLPTSVTVPRDAAPGSVIASARYNYSFNQSSPVGVYCNTGVTVDWISGNGQSANTDGVIPSGTPGIGYRLKATSSEYALKPGSSQVPVTTFTTPSLCGYPASGKCYLYLGSPIILELVKTGEVYPGAEVSGGLLLSQRVGGFTSSTITLSTPLVHVTPQTCTLQTRQPVNVAFGPIGIGEMKNLNSVSSARTFRLSIDCRGTSTKLAVTFTDATSPSNRSDVLSLSRDSTATGFGIQILLGAQKVRFGADSRDAGNPNQLLLGTVANRIHEEQFTARYIRTATNAKAGKANGSATFTMSYQ